MEEASYQVHMFVNGVNSFPDEKTKLGLTLALHVEEIVPSARTCSQNFHLKI
jgi:hypothetical protein